MNPSLGAHIDKATITDVIKRPDGAQEITYTYDRQLVPETLEANLFLQHAEKVSPDLDDIARVKADLAQGRETTARLLMTVVASPSTKISPDVKIEPGATVMITHWGDSRAVQEIKEPTGN